MVTATVRAPRASSRRRGAPAGPARAGATAAPASGDGASSAGGSKASARGTGSRRAPQKTQASLTRRAGGPAAAAAPGEVVARAVSGVADRPAPASW